MSDVRIQTLVKDLKDLKKQITDIIQDFEGQYPFLKDEKPSANVMPFGKHKGKDLAKIPISYFEWLLQQPENGRPLDPILKNKINSLMKG